MKYFQLILFALLFVGVSIAQENNDKAATLTVTGEGTTKQEALHGALRSAIEQAFGAFISSNTQVLNDELAKDEIVSIANGNIQKYEILSEVQLPDGRYANTLRATVSVSKLTSFCENKGITVEFKGALFALNAKQQLLNEQNEIKAVENMVKVLKGISDHSFDYEIKAGEPTEKLVKVLNQNREYVAEKKWSVPIEITVKINNNLKLLTEYLNKTLVALSLSNQEVESYNKLGKKVYIASFEKQVYFRGEKSIESLADLFFYFRHSILNFSIKDGGEGIKGVDLVDYYSKGYKDYWPKIKAENFKPLYLRGYYAERGILFSSFQGHENEWGEYERWWQELRAQTVLLSEYKQFDIKFSLSKFQKGQSIVTLSFTDVRTLDELSKVSGYSIAPNN